VVTNPKSEKTVLRKINSVADDLKELDKNEKISFKKVAKELIKTNLVSAQNNQNQFRPIYRVAITYPIEDKTTKELKIYTNIIADTTITKARDIGGAIKESVRDTTKYIRRQFGMGISDVLGIWVDSDDIATPDKATVLLRVDPKLTLESILGAPTVDDSWLSMEGTFAVRNWMDIWIGYEGPDGKIYPDSFGWFSDTHVFTGPVVLVDRKFSNTGDTISVSGYSPEIILKNATYKRLDGQNAVFKFSTEHEGGTQKLFREAMLDLFDKLIPMSLWKKQVDTYAANNKVINDEITYEDAFPIGDFYWELFKEGIFYLKAVMSLGTKGKEDSRYNGTTPIPLLDPLLDSSIFSATRKDSDVKIKAPPVMPDRQLPNFWDVLQKLLLPETSNNEGLNIKLLKTRNHIMAKYPVIPSEEGVNEHIGMWFHFYFGIERDEYLELSKQSNQESVKLPYLDPEHDIRYITMGEDVIDLNSYIDYGTVFNSFRIYTKSRLRNPDDDVVTQEVTEPIIFPIEGEKIFNNILDPNSRLAGFWANILKDVVLYGEQLLPTIKWFSVVQKEGETQQKLYERLGITPDAAERLGTIKIPIGAVLSQEGIARMYRRYYFGGLEGTSMIIGNPQMKTGRFVGIRNARNTMNVAVGGGIQADDITSKLFGGVGKSLYQSYNTIQKIVDFKVGYADRVYYIWKVRHYYGANAGYQTKVYFTQSRSRAWRLQTRDIAGALQEARKATRGL
jgi:hypothetical protein